MQKNKKIKIKLIKFKNIYFFSFSLENAFEGKSGASPNQELEHNSPMGMACDFQYLGKGNQALHSHRMTEMNKMYHCKTTYFSQFLVVVEDY